MRRSGIGTTGVRYGRAGDAGAVAAAAPSASIQRRNSARSMRISRPRRCAARRRSAIARRSVRVDNAASALACELRRYTAWLAGVRGITGLVTNGHTGEGFALDAKERAEVTRIAVDEVDGRLPVVSGICVEGINEACEHALMAKHAGASALLVMPPHQWLRFGKKPEHVVEHFSEIGKASGLDRVVHVYPAWTRANYSSELLATLAHLPHVKAFKVGTRDMKPHLN